MGLTESQIQKVWEMGTKIDGVDPKKMRKDMCGAWITRSAYGSNSQDYGWVVDLKVPLQKGGKLELANLQPMQWRNAESRKEGRCEVVSRGTRNVLAKAPVWPKG